MTMPRGVLALGLAGVLLLALGAQAPATPPGRGMLGPQAVAQAEQMAQAASGPRQQLDDEAARLRAALAAPRRFIAPARNPFNFHQPAPQSHGPAKVPAADVAAMPSVPAAAPALLPPAWPTLIAIVADAGGAAPAAMLSFDGETAIVAAGQMFVRFRVQAITDGAVELIDVTSPSRVVRTLPIR